MQNDREIATAFHHIPFPCVLKLLEKFEDSKIYEIFKTVKVFTPSKVHSNISMITSLSNNFKYDIML